MKDNYRKLGSSFLQITVCLFVLFAVIRTGTVSYALYDVGEKREIEDELILTEEKPSGSWIELSGKIYYLDQNNNYVRGLQFIDNSFRYFSEDGSLYTGWKEINGMNFYFRPDCLGALATNEVVIDGINFNFLQTGEFITGFYNTKEGTFYKNQFGYDEFGFIVDNGKKYYISQDGLLKGSFVLSHTYYTDNTGAIYSGKVYIEGKESYFSEDGEYQYGWLRDENGFKYKSIDSNFVVGKNSIDGKEYYFDENGYLITNQIIGMYQADGNGNLTKMPISVSNLDAALDEILEVTGKDIKSIGEYVRTHHKYKYIDKLGSREEMAVYALNNRYISCYYYEALTGLLLERAGYEVITIAGVGFVYAEHYWSLVNTSRNGIEGWYHVDSLKAKYIRTDKEMVADGFKWTHENYPPTP